MPKAVPITSTTYTPPYHRRSLAYAATGSIPPLPIALQRHFRLLVGATVATILVWGIWA